MPRPRRKHVRLNVFAESARGRAFLAAVGEALGDDVSYRPRARTDDGVHVFDARGSYGAGTLAETPDRPTDGGVFVTLTDFFQRRWTIDGSGMWSLRLATHRADPALYERAGIDAPPRTSRAWWRAERARVGDAMDWLEESFEPDPEPAPMSLEDGLMVRRVFGCSMCRRRASRVTHYPVGHETVNGPPVDDVRRQRLTVEFGGSSAIFIATPEQFDRFDAARRAVVLGDAVLLAGIEPGWAPFFCRECERSYCDRHWDEASCPYGHEMEALEWSMGEM